MQEAFDHGIRLFNAGEFFVCHEVLEELWRPARGPRRLFLQSVIHLAAGFHHFQRGNPAGGAPQLRKGLRKLAGYLPACEGVDTALLYRESLAWLDRVQGGGPAAPFPKIVLLSGGGC